MPEPSTTSTSSLVAAFQRFSAISAELTAAYAQLEQQVAEVNASLQQAYGANLHVETETRRLAGRLSRLLEALPAAVILVDARDRVDQFNHAAQVLFPSLSWGRRWGEVLAENLQKELDSESWLLRDSVQVSLTRRPLDEHGQILVLVDQTERRLLENRVQQQERLSLLGEMAARLAHQVRTPLSAAMLYADQLMRDDVSPAQRRRFAKKLSARLHHTEQIVADMLAFARGESVGTDTLVLQQLLKDAMDMVAPRFQAANVSLCDLSGEVPAIDLIGNREALTGALLNLLNNAVDHGGDCVRVSASLAPDAAGCRLLIEDNGPGIPEPLRERVFEPFFTTSSTGTGLGLAVVNAVVLEHGGRLSCLPGPGGRFEIVLPIVETDMWQSLRSNTS